MQCFSVNTEEVNDHLFGYQCSPKYVLLLYVSNAGLERAFSFLGKLSHMLNCIIAYVFTAGHFTLTDTKGACAECLQTEIRQDCECYGGIKRNYKKCII